MKKVSIFVFMALIGVAAFSPAKVYAADCQETVLDKAWDWATTLGKSGLDKDSVLVKNKAERAQKCAEKIAKQAQKEAGAAASDMKKKLGL